LRKVKLSAKRNRDGSYSVSYESGALVRDALIDFYNEQTGVGYQRNETLRPKRGRDIEDYIRRCVTEQMEPKLFEMTANARVEPKAYRYEGLDKSSQEVGHLIFEVPEGKKWLSIIDGGTRLLGIENALAHHIIDETTLFDVRVFVGLTLAEEVAQFLLINENQKKVRTDLSLRVVQRRLDEGKLSDRETRALQTVVPDTDAWRFEASRIAAQMNSDVDSPWRNRIQMPGDVTKPLTLQAFFTSLKPILSDADVKTPLEQMEKTGSLVVNGMKVTPTAFLVQVLKNFWAAVAVVNPDANSEPETTVLWGAIGASSCHIALAPILKTVLQSPDRNLTTKRFEAMLGESQVANYPYWFTKKGTKQHADRYPGQKGDGTLMTGAANYGRLAKILEKEWRAKLHADSAVAMAVA